MKACTAANAPPATAAVTSPIHQWPNLSAPSAAKNAPESIIPSSPMFTTPLRSENMPPIAANVSGVAHTSVAERSADQTTTWLRLPWVARVASMPRPIPTMPKPIAVQPGRRRPRVSTQMPVPIAISPTSTGTHGRSALKGGSATTNANSPIATPARAISVSRGQRDHSREA